MCAKKVESKRLSPAASQRALCKETTELVRSLIRHYHAFEAASKNGVTLDNLVQTVHDTARKSLSAKKYTAIRDHLLPLVRELTQLEYNEQHPASVAFLGPLYSYSHLATSQYFGSNITPHPVPTISNVFETVLKQEADFGVVPIENSTDGRIVDTLNVLARSPVSICGEINLPIHHTLLSLSALTDIREIYSKPQALSQCREWIAKHLPNATLVDTPSTTVAAELASQTPGAAAIASVLAGEHYGLNTLASKIEDRQGNVTRFAVIGDHQPTPSGSDKTTLIVELAHAPGALADAMLAFKKQSLNLTWIESFPKPNHPSEYVFFIELEGHREDAAVQTAISNLERKTQRISVLGSFPIHRPNSR